jgi:hypothetical protein
MSLSEDLSGLGTTSLAEDLVREFLAALAAATEAANRSVLDGTISCRVCRGLVLEQNAEGHYAWHAAGGDGQ